MPSSKVSINVRLFINDTYSGYIAVSYVPFSDTFSIDLNTFILALKPIQNTDAISNLLRIPNPEISTIELEELGYEIAEYNKQKLILRIISPIESRKLNILEFKDSNIKPTYYKPSPISGSSSFQLFQSYSSSTNEMTPIELKNRTTINYGNNLFSYDGSGFVSKWNNSYINLSRKIIDTKLSLGDVKSFSISNVGTQSSIWGINMMHAPSKLRAINNSQDYSIFLKETSYITILINDSPYASYKLPAGPHKITKIPKVLGPNKIVIKAKPQNSQDNNIILSKSFYYDPNNIPNTWKLNIHYGYPKLLEKNLITHQSNLIHTGANFFYVYTPYFRADHILSFGPNFQLFGLTSNLFTPKGNAIWNLSFGEAEDTETYSNTLIFNTKSNPNKPEEPWRISATHTESYLNFAVDKGFNFLPSMSYLGNYNYNIRKSLTSQSYSSTFQWNISKSQSFAYSNGFSIDTQFNQTHQFRYKIVKDSSSFSMNVDFSPSAETPFNFSFIFSQSLSRLGLSYMIDTFELNNVSYVKSIENEIALSITESIPKKNTSIQFKNDTFNLTSFIDKSNDILRKDSITYSDDIFNFSYDYSETKIQNNLFNTSSYSFSTNIFFTDSAFSLSSAETSSFAIISPQYNLINQPIRANEFENNFMGNILVPLKGTSTILLEAPNASMWTELGQQNYILNPPVFSGYHIKFGGIGTHAAMLVLQDKIGTPLQRASVTISPIKTDIKIEDKSYTIGYGGRIVAVGLIPGKYKLTFDDDSYGDIIFTIAEDDEPLVRFGIVEVSYRSQVISAQNQEQIKTQQQELIKRLFKTNTNDSNLENNEGNDNDTINKESAEELDLDQKSNATNNNTEKDDEIETETETETEAEIETETDLVDENEVES